MSRLLLSCLVGLAILATGVEPARADPPIWRVRDADTEMVLFGSVHTLPEGVEWRSAALDAALADADLVVFEVREPGEDDEAAAFAILLPFLRYLIGEELLSETISAETFARLGAAAERFDMPVEVLDMMQPWAAALMLDMAAEEALGRTSDLGVESQIEATLPEGQRTEALDTPEMLGAVFQALSDLGAAEGEALLVEALDVIESRTELDTGMDEAWMTGDMAAIQAEMDAMKAEAPGLFKVILIDRNHGWMPALTRMMQTEGRVVVVVGAAHMVGEHGLPTLLEAAGYEVVRE